MDPSDEIAILRRELTALERTVDVLVELLCQADAFGAMSGAQVRRKLSAAARDAQEEHDDEAKAQEPTALAQSAYRGVAPGVGGLACALCRKVLAEDDPELVREDRGRVCISCFHRADDR